MTDSKICIADFDNCIADLLLSLLMEYFYLYFDKLIFTAKPAISSRELGFWSIYFPESQDVLEAFVPSYYSNQQIGLKREKFTCQLEYGLQTG